MSIASKTAVVTGPAAGIGLAIARAFAIEGCNLLINGFGESAATETERAAIERNFGVMAICGAADMSRPEEIAGMIAHAENIFGSVDILVNNAGIQFVSPIEDFPIEKWDQIIAINLSSAFHAMRAAIPGMKARGWGRIINMSPVDPLVPSPFESAFVAAQHGLAGLTRAAAVELASFGVTVNSVTPGYASAALFGKQILGMTTANDMTQGQTAHDALLVSWPNGKSVIADQVAALAVFLSSDAASQITGANISIDAESAAE
jgi:3-hydroxybutyrate dehydrogenase